MWSVDSGPAMMNVSRSSLTSRLSVEDSWWLTTLLGYSPLSSMIVGMHYVQWWTLTVLASVSPTYGRDGGASSHYQLVKVTLVICGLRLLEDKVVQI